MHCKNSKYLFISFMQRNNFKCRLFSLFLDCLYFCISLIPNMTDESIAISAKTWSRTADSIHKVSYSDGIVDGEKSAFQASFDMGYQEGFCFAFNSSNQNMLQDTLQDNCIICSDNAKLKDNVTNLYNLQKDSNKILIRDKLNLGKAS